MVVIRLEAILVIGARRKLTHKEPEWIGNVLQLQPIKQMAASSVVFTVRKIQNVAES